jgi:hypothetical protein
MIIFLLFIYLLSDLKIPIQLGQMTILSSKNAIWLRAIRRSY